MEYFLKIINWCYEYFKNTIIPIHLSGTQYDISLLAILIFTAVLGTVVVILFSAFK